MTEERWNEGYSKVCLRNLHQYCPGHQTYGKKHLCKCPCHLPDEERQKVDPELLRRLCLLKDETT